MDRPPLPPAPLRLPDADVLLRRALGDKAGGRAVGRLDEAARAFTDERFSDSRRILNQLVERAPQVPEVLELLGLVHYRMGHWRAAAKRMEAFYSKPLRNTEETLVSTRRKVATVGNSELFFVNKGLVSPDIG